MSAARFLSHLAVVALLAACSGGPGASGTINVEPREPPGKSGAPEPAGAFGSPEPTSGAPEGPNGDSGVSSGSGGSSSGVGSCPACNQNYSCTIPAQNVTVTVALATTDKGQCVIIGTADIFSCDGEITINGQFVPWTAYGDGGFIVNDQDQTETCLPY